jgi:hypothetical protein
MSRINSALEEVILAATLSDITKELRDMIVEIIDDFADVIYGLDSMYYSKVLRFEILSPQ